MRAWAAIIAPAVKECIYNVNGDLRAGVQLCSSGELSLSLGVWGRLLYTKYCVLRDVHERLHQGSLTSERGSSFLLLPIMLLSSAPPLARILQYDNKYLQ